MIRGARGSISGEKLMKQMSDHKYIINVNLAKNNSFNRSYYYNTKKHRFEVIDKIEKIDGANRYAVTKFIVDRNGKPIDGAEAFTDEVTIDSNYKLWNVLGGSHSASLSDNGELVLSNASIEKVADVANNVNILATKYNAREGNFERIDGEYTFADVIDEAEAAGLSDGEIEALKNRLKKYSSDKNMNDRFSSQSYYFQPLKHSDIHYIA